MYTGHPHRGQFAQNILILCREYRIIRILDIRILCTGYQNTTSFTYKRYLSLCVRHKSVELDQTREDTVVSLCGRSHLEHKMYRVSQKKFTIKIFIFFGGLLISFINSTGKGMPRGD